MLLKFPALLLGLLLTASTPTEHKLNWDPAKKLTWTHFQGAPESGSQYAAMTRIDMSIQQGSTSRHDAIELIVLAELVTNGSWVKPDKKTDVILAHEQGHFDIAEYHARRLRKELLERAPFTADRLNEEVDAIFDRIFLEKEQMQQEYDQQTDHSMVRETQLAWEQRIVHLLDSLSDHTSPNVLLTLK